MIEKLKKEVAELKAKLAKAMLKESFAATKTDKAILVHETEELNVGTEVFVEDEEGNRTPAEDGIYTLEDGNQVKVGNGKVEEIIEPTEEETEAEETEVEAAKQTPTAEYATKAEVEAMVTVVTELKDAVDAFFAKVNSANEEISARLSKVEQMPAGKTPAEEFKNEREIKTGDSVLDRKLENIRRFKK
jgi:hypothetical protein